MKILKVVLILAVITIILSFGFLHMRNKFLPRQYNQYIEQYSKEYNINPNLVRAVIKVESNYNPMAVSNAGAYGLMQITKETGYFIASNIGDGDFNQAMLYQPQVNIKFACWYLSNLKKEFHNENDVIAAYNAGRGNVSQWLNNPDYSKNGQTLSDIPFSETSKYVKNVNMYEKLYTKLY